MTTDPRLVIQPEQTTFTGFQLSTLRQMGVTQASAGDLAAFFYYAKRYNLDPFTQAVTMVWRNDHQTIQVDIVGFRAVASVIAAELGVTPILVRREFERVIVEGDEERFEYHPTWPPAGVAPGTPPDAAIHVISVDGVEYFGGAAYTEYLAKTPDGQIIPEWNQDPVRWLTNVAEAIAYRKALGGDLDNVWLNEEAAPGDRYATGRKDSGYGKIRTARQ